MINAVDQAEIIHALEQYMEMFGNLFLDNTTTQIMSTVVPLTLANTAVFGADKISDDMSTGSLFGEGGEYQIIYAWRLIK